MDPDRIQVALVKLILSSVPVIAIPMIMVVVAVVPIIPVPIVVFEPDLVGRAVPRQ
ncbi:hypothetical protein JCM12296A_02440 [Desulfosarcina cetonica]